MSEELSRVEDLLENGVEQPVLPMSELEAILRGEKIKPHSRVAELLLQYNPQDILIEKSITENGTYYASADNAAGYFKVIVDTPVIPPVVLDHLVETITQNGTYNYTSEHDGYSDAEITVNVPTPQPVVASKTITENDTYVAADEQLDGYSQVVVNVPPTPMDTMNITHNGTYHPPTGRGFDEVNVTVPLGSKSITANGTYVATDDNLDGYSSVAVDVPQIGIKDIPNTPTPIATFSDGTDNPLKSLTASIVPVQDLHGYDSPWAGGAGKNKFDQTTWQYYNVSRKTNATNIPSMVALLNSLPVGYYTISVKFKVDTVEATQTYRNYGFFITTTGSYSVEKYTRVDSPTVGAIYEASITVNKSSEDIEFTAVYIYAGRSTVTDTATIYDMQLESGQTATTFAPYSNICPISGWTEVDVQRDGVNIFPLYTPNSITSNGVTATLNTDGSITFSGTATSNASFSIKNNGSLNANPYASDAKVLDLDADSYYTISKYNDSGKLRIMVLAAETPAQSVIVDFINENSGRFKGHPSYKFIMRVDSGTTINETIKLQLEKGSTATTYEPYAGTTYTIPFVDSQGNPVEVFGGSVDVVNGGEQPNDGKLVDFSTASIMKNNPSDNNDYLYYIRNLPVDKNKPIICSHAPFLDNPPTGNTLGIAVSGSGSIYINLTSSVMTENTVEFLRQYCINNNVQIKYGTATPTTFYTQPTSIKSLDGENNVFASTGEILSGQYFGYVYPELGTKTITENGTYDPADDGLDGYSEVNVTIPLGTKTITENGTYTATDDNLDGYSQVTIDVAGGGGETKYYEYIRALNGQIIVRVEYPDAERTYATKTLWFFNGYDTDSSDKDIPSILIPYLPKNWSTDVMLTSGYTDNTSATQLGWVGFLYPNRTPPSTKIRTWNISKGGLQSGSFWGVLDISGPEEQITEWFDPYENVPPRQIKNYGGTIEDGYNLNTDLKDLGNVYHDSAMSYEIDNDSFDITWNESGAYIGFSFNGDVDLKASDIQRLSYKIDFGTCYDAAWNQNIRPFVIGVTDTIRTTPSTGIYFDPSNVDQYFTKYKMYYKDVCNTTVEDFVDISDIEGPCYLFIVATGWIASITDLSMISNSTPQIGTTLSQFNFFNYMSEDSNANKIIPIDTESFDVYWSGAIYIGHCLTGAIPLSGKKRLDIDMDYIGENYQHNSGTHTRNHNLAIVVTDIKVDSYVNLDNLERDNHIIAIKEWDGNDIYGQSIHTSIDLSNISGEYYINYQLPGYNIDGFKARLYSINAILPKYPNKVILNNKPIQNDQGSWITYNFDTPLTVGKSYLIMWSSGKSVDTYPFATAFTLTNSSASVSLTAHGVTATLSISTTSLVGTYSNDYDTRLRHINLLEIPSEFSDGLIY